MKLLYSDVHEGVYFSKNGQAAYLRGEKPRFMWPESAKVVETVAHHIARPIAGRGYSRELVMFYRSQTPQNF